VTDYLKNLKITANVADYYETQSNSTFYVTFYIRKKKKIT